MGLLDPLYYAVSWIIVQFHELFSLFMHKDSGWTWALSITCLVLVVRAAMIPLFVKQIKSSRAMAVLSPKIREIQTKYKNHPNGRELQAKATMELYKEHKANPLASCLPIVVQMPFFFALYQVLNSAATSTSIGALTDKLAHSAGHAHIFGAELSATFKGSLESGSISVPVLAGVMILLMCASQFYQQKYLMMKNMTPEALNSPFMQQQKLMMYLFPVIFAVSGILFPVGVLIYWITSNAWTLGQQIVVIRRMPSPGSEAEKLMKAKQEAKARRRAERSGSLVTASAGAGGETTEATELDAPKPSQRQQPTRKPRSQRGPKGPKR